MPYKTQQPVTTTKKGYKTAETKQKNEDVEMADAQQKKTGLQKVKESGIQKTPKDTLRKRRNFRLKKLLTPKPALMLLHELFPEANLVFEFNDTAENPPKGTMPQIYSARSFYNGKEFQGNGPSKSQAKNACSEKILQHIVNTAVVSEKNKESADEKENNDNKEHHKMETDIPWSTLASLAIYKMFNEWQTEGVSLPFDMGKGEKDDKPNNPKEKNPAVSNKKKEKKSLPENPTEKHPVMLLNEMEGPLEYVETNKGEGVYSVSVAVQGKNFTGQGNSKKEAKKKAAMNALKAIHRVVYTN